MLRSAISLCVHRTLDYFGSPAGMTKSLFHVLWELNLYPFLQIHIMTMLIETLLYLRNGVLVVQRAYLRYVWPGDKFYGDAMYNMTSDIVLEIFYRVAKLTNTVDLRLRHWDKYGSPSVGDVVRLSICLSVQKRRWPFLEYWWRYSPPCIINMRSNNAVIRLTGLSINQCADFCLDVLRNLFVLAVLLREKRNMSPLKLQPYVEQGCKPRLLM